jgi:mRNA interferase MazF
MAQPERAEVWLADLGLAAKVRPVLVLSVPYSDADYALVCVIPRTTTPRGTQFEVNMQVPGLQPGAFNLQGMLAVPTAKFLRRLAKLDANQMRQIEVALKRWLAL